MVCIPDRRLSARVRDQPVSGTKLRLPCYACMWAAACLGVPGRTQESMIVFHESMDHAAANLARLMNIKPPQDASFIYMPSGLSCQMQTSWTSCGA